MERGASIRDIGTAINGALERLPVPELEAAYNVMQQAGLLMLDVARGHGDQGGLSEIMDDFDKIRPILRMLLIDLHHVDRNVIKYCRAIGVVGFNGGLGSVETPSAELVGPELAAQLAKQQEDIIITGFDTFRTLDDLQAEMGDQLGIDLRQIVTGKVVCDMGAGMGGLAKSMQAEGLPGEVHSVSPRLSEPQHKITESREGRWELKTHYPHLTDSDLDRIQAVHDTNLHPVYAHEIDLPDESVDVVLDMFAVHAYMANSPELYERTIRQYARILKPGGKVYVFNPNHQRPRHNAVLDARQAAAEAAGLRHAYIERADLQYVAGVIMTKA